MRIALHQIHNVLNAYAKRLSDIQNSLNSGGASLSPPPDSEPNSVEDKRRLIVSKISTDMIERMLLARHQPDQKTNDPSDAPVANPRPPLPSDRFTYRMITAEGESLITHMEIEDPGFLINQMDPTAHKPEDQP